MALTKEQKRIRNICFPGGFRNRRKMPWVKGRLQFLPREELLDMQRRGRRTFIENADIRTHYMAGYIAAAVREVGHSYSAVARWLMRERILTPRGGKWWPQTVKHYVKRYERMTGKCILHAHHTFPTPRRRKDALPKALPWEARRPRHPVRVRGFGRIHPV